MPQRNKQILALVLFFVVSFAAAAIGSSFTAPAIESWYSTIAKPAWNPPNAIFAPVWTVLFCMMAVAGWLAWRRSASKLPVVFFAVQLALNSFWSFCFFGLRNPAAGLAEIVFLWCAIVANTVVFFRASRAAGFLFLPYLGWVTFAAALNFEIWRLNS